MALDYELVVSKRAKRATLKVQRGRGLVVTIPARFPRREVPAVVEEHRGWIEAQLAKLDAETPAHLKAWPPTHLDLLALERRVEIEASETGETATVSAGWRGTAYMQLAGALSDRALVARAVARLLRDEARPWLAARLATRAAESGFAYRRLQIRGQRSRWGSCSTKGTISLNYKLLFLPPELVDYVIRHELVHTREMNHARSFWMLLEAVQPDARRLDDRLREAGALVPPWLELA